MIAEILSTGDEVLKGTIVDSNSAYIAEQLVLHGIGVARHMCVGDDRDALVAIVKEISSRADIAIVTGGLGPTSDDLTAETMGMAAGAKLVFSETADRSIENFFKKFGRPRSDSDKKQAMIPEGAECLLNPVGTAPGFMIKIAKCNFFCIPGVPSEMREMLSNSVLPFIQKITGNDRKLLLTRTMSVFGLPEAAVGEHLRELEERFPGIKLGLCAEFPEIKVNLYLKSEDNDNLHGIADEASSWVIDKIGKHVFSKTGESMPAEVGRLLRKENSTISVAESCTGGLISHMLTNVAGSSAYFLFSAITYSNQAKMDVLGVSSKSLKQFGAVSEEVAKEMAKGARHVTGSVYGLSTSGIAGPDGGTDEKPLGTICVGIAGPDFEKGFRYTLSFGSRSRNKTIFAMAALELLRRELNSNRT
jgi:competence/damage-inducible protein CinA-like protein